MSELIGDAIKAIVFDFDDTLVGTYPASWELHRHIAQTYYGIHLDDAAIRAHWGRPLPELARNYYQTDMIEEAVDRIVQHQFDFPKAKFDHAVLAIRQLKLGKKILGIVSATTRPILENDAELAGLPLADIDYIQTAEDSDYHKPDRRVFDPMLLWMKQKSIEPNDILYVGDGLHDMHAAKGAGLHFIGVTTGLVGAEEFAARDAQSIDNLLELGRRVDFS